MLASGTKHEPKRDDTNDSDNSAETNDNNNNNDNDNENKTKTKTTTTTTTTTTTMTMTMTMTKPNQTKKKRKGIVFRITSQRIFLLVGCLCFCSIYASLRAITIDPGDSGPAGPGVDPRGYAIPTETAIAIGTETKTETATKAKTETETNTKIGNQNLTSTPTSIATRKIGKPQKPRLEDYIQGWNITRDVNWLLDFAIVGFPKTGTSTLMLYLKQQQRSNDNDSDNDNNIFVFGEERCEMGWNQHVPLLRDLHAHYEHYDEPNKTTKNKNKNITTTKSKRLLGIKCPRDLEVDLARNNYDTYFPSTKFIVGVRHPIEWFESFYNFRIRNGFPMLVPPEKHVGRCRTLHRGVCTDRARFGEYLSRVASHRRVFLYDVHQLGGERGGHEHEHEHGIEIETETETETFRKDLAKFLGLPSPLVGPMLHVTPGRGQSQPQPQPQPRLPTKRTKTITNSTGRPLRELQDRHQLQQQQQQQQQQNEQLSATANTNTNTNTNNASIPLMDICEHSHARLRGILLGHASESARWILDTFLTRPTVTVSSPDRFRALLEKWHRDPCDKNKNKNGR